MSDPGPERLFNILKFFSKHFRSLCAIIEREKEFSALKSEHLIAKEQLESCEQERDRLNKLNDSRVHNDLEKERELVTRLNEENKRNQNIY